MNFNNSYRIKSYRKEAGGVVIAIPHESVGYYNYLIKHKNDMHASKALQKLVIYVAWFLNYQNNYLDLE